MFPSSTEKGIFSKTVINRIERRGDQNDENTFAFLLPAIQLLRTEIVNLKSLKLEP